MATTKCSLSMPVAIKTYTVGYKNTHNMRRNSCHIPVSGCTAEQHLHMHTLPPEHYSLFLASDTYMYLYKPNLYNQDYDLKTSVQHRYPPSINLH